MNYEIEYAINPLSGISYYEEFRNENLSSSNVLEKGIQKILNGNFGNCERIRSCNDGNVGNISELKIDYGKGFRIYYSLKNNKIRILNCGIKKTQKKDVKKARMILNES